KVDQVCFDWLEAAEDAHFQNGHVSHVVCRSKLIVHVAHTNVQHENDWRLRIGSQRKFGKWNQIKSFRLVLWLVRLLWLRSFRMSVAGHICMWGRKTFGKVGPKLVQRSNATFGQSRRGATISEN